MNYIEAFYILIYSAFFISRDLVVLYFYLEDSDECNQMTDVINEVDKSRDHTGIMFLKVNILS